MLLVNSQDGLHGTLYSAELLHYNRTHLDMSDKMHSE